MEKDLDKAHEISNEQADDKICKNPDWKLLIIRLMAGGYLIYLAVHLLKEKGSEAGPAAFIVPVVFLAAGAVIGGWAVVKLAKGEFER